LSFETHLEVFGDLMQITLELIRAWRSVEGRFITHGSEQRLVIVLVLAVLVDTLLSKFGLGLLPLVNLTLPDFVVPGGSAESD
jgi:hypothetical protein